MTLILKLAWLSQSGRQWLLRLLQIEMQNVKSFTRSKYCNQPLPPIVKTQPLWYLFTNIPSDLLPTFLPTYPAWILLSSFCILWALRSGHVRDILQLCLQIVQSPFPCRRRLNWQTRSTHRTHHSPDRLFSPSISHPYFPFFSSICFLFVNTRQMGAHPLGSLCGCRCANCVSPK